MKLASAPLPVLVATCVAMAAGSALAERRFAVVVGNNIGARDESALQFAEDDAQKVADTLTRVAGFSRDDVVVVRGAAPSGVRRALIEANDRVRQSSEPALLFVYYSGHADADALHLGDERFDLDELEGLVRGSAASFRVLVLDACRSGAMTNVKGARGVESFALPAAKNATASGAFAEGYVVLTAATAGEDAQESETLRGSFFTHHLVSGLLGAADRDGDREVTLAEAYRHAFTQTVRASSATLAGTQHPTFRYDVRGRGDVVLASLARAAKILGTLAVPPGIDVLVFDKDGGVAAEVASNVASRAISLPPGKYVVRGRGRDVLYEGELALSSGARVDVELASLQRIEYARLVRKGESERGFVLAPRVAVIGHTAWLEGGGTCHGGNVAALVASRFVSVGPRLALCGAAWSNDVVSATETELSADVVVAHAFDLPLVTLEVGAFGGVVHINQTFATKGTAPPLSALAPSFGVSADILLDLPFLTGGFAGAGVDARALIVRAHPTLDIDTPVSVGWRAQIGWHL